jgi:chemotaxis protein methyltransferase CheR
MGQGISTAESAFLQGEDSLQLKDEEFHTLTEFMNKNYGINLRAKRTLVEGRLRNYLLKHGYNNYGSFIKTVLSDPKGTETQQLVNQLTTNYSYFMREWDHFVYFQKVVLPELKAGIRDKDMRIWSAGCSTGEEPYTLSMLINDFLDDEKAQWDKKILATDISAKALEKAVEGVYPAEDLEKVPPGWKLTYFNRMQGGQWQVKENLRDEVIFRTFNLMEDYFPFKKQFDVIFCRNVMIYFDKDSKNELIEKFYDATKPGGYLFIGQSESVDRNMTRYKYVMPSILKKAV